jgi:hypothetical protein
MEISVYYLLHLNFALPCVGKGGVLHLQVRAVDCWWQSCHAWQDSLMSRIAGEDY